MQPQPGSRGARRLQSIVRAPQGGLMRRFAFIAALPLIAASASATPVQLMAGHDVEARTETILPGASTAGPVLDWVELRNRSAAERHVSLAFNDAMNNVA